MKPQNHQYNHPDRKNLRRELRTHGTAAEASLWSLLKRRQVANALFRRQFSIGPYVMDFYCPAARLCVELDGAEHFAPDGESDDMRRDEYLLAEHGIRTLRFENGMVFTQPENVIAAIREALAERLQSRAPSSLGGRGGEGMQSHTPSFFGDGGCGEMQSHTPSPLRGTPPTLGGELPVHGNPAPALSGEASQLRESASNLEGESHAHTAKGRKSPFRNSSPNLGEVAEGRRSTETWEETTKSPEAYHTPPSPLGAEANE